MTHRVHTSPIVPASVVESRSAIVDASKSRFRICDLFGSQGSVVVVRFLDDIL